MKVQIGTLRKHTIFDDIRGTRWEVTDHEKHIVYARRLSDGRSDCFSNGAEATPVEMWVAPVKTKTGPRP